VPPNDVFALADALEALLRDAHLRQALGEAGRRKVEQQFNLADNLAQWRSLFRGQG
jgi:glycosyltransferase involved in cell wall biosynthesis